MIYRCVKSVLYEEMDGKCEINIGRNQVEIKFVQPDIGVTSQTDVIHARLTTNGWRLATANVRLITAFYIHSESHICVDLANVAVICC